MRVWLYARLSNDDDREMNSLLNQREICQAFAEQHGYIIVKCCCLSYTILEPEFKKSLI